MGLSYIKRKNLIEFAVMRGCTAKAGGVSNATTDNVNREGDTGWPGMMSIRVHELDGTYDHPSLPLAGDTWQLLEIQCHSKLTSKRIQKPKKGSKPDGSDDNADAVQNLDLRSRFEVKRVIDLLLLCTSYPFRVSRQKLVYLLQCGFTLAMDQSGS